MKKAQGEVKKSMSTFSRLQKKANKDNREETMKQLCESRVDFQRRLEHLEKVAGNGVRNVMMEERKRYSTFVHIIRPFVEEEISMLGDITHLQEIMDELIKQTSTTIMLSEEELLDGVVFPLHRNFSSPSPPRVHPKLHPSFSLTSDPSLTTKAQTRHHQNSSSEAELSQANTKSEERAGNDNMVQSKHCSRSQHHRSTLSHLNMRLRPHSVAMTHNGMKANNAALIMQRSETCDGSSYRFEGNALKEENMTRSLCMEDTCEDIFSTRFDDMISTLNTLDKDAKEPAGPKTEENDARPKERSKLQFCYPNSDDITPTNENQEHDFAEQFLSQLQKESYIPNNEVVDNIAVQDNEGVKQIATPTCTAQTHVSKESTI